jgi:hypothetical protein
MYYMYLMDIERRLTPRHAFGGVIEISAVQPSVYFVAQTTEVSRHGCFVRTPQSLPSGTEIRLRITHGGREFNASGRVVYVLPEKGLGVSFSEITNADNVLLGKWLKEAGAE